jgi:hypothetical protein
MQQTCSKEQNLVKISGFFGGVVTDDWVDAIQASTSLGLCDCVLASSGI